MPIDDGRVRSVQWLCLYGSGLLMLLSLAACGVAGESTAGPTPAAASTGVAAVSPGGTAAKEAHFEESRPLGDTTASAPTEVVTMKPVDSPTHTPDGSWQAYHSPRGGYTVEYPAGWRVDEAMNGDGSLVTVFAPPTGGTGIGISVRQGAPQVESNDIPNTRCRQVTVAGLSGTRCFDTISSSTSATLYGRGKTFTISAGKHGDQATFEHILNSFRPSP